MRIIYRYITKELISPLLFGTAAFTGIFIGTDLLFDLIEYYTDYGVKVLTLVQLFFLNLPAIAVLTLPMATLLGTILAFSRLSADSEITALRAGGISIYRLVMPAIAVGLVMTLLTIGVNEFVVPKANYLNEQIVWEFKHGFRKPASQNNLLLPSTDGQGRPDFFLYAGKFDGDTGIMEDVIFQDFQEGRPVQLIEAEEAVWKDDGGWIFVNGRIIHLEAGERIPALTFAEYENIPLSYKPTQISKLNKTIDEMNIRELKGRIELEASQGKNINGLIVSLQQRIAIPFANIIFALLAAVLGILPQRSGGSATGMGISIIVIFVYYSLLTIGNALGEEGTISPVLGAWLQNIVFLGIGGIMLYRIGK